MGYYIEGPTHGKARFIRETYDGEIPFHLVPPSQLPAGKALICVVDNGFFEAAGFCYDDGEYEAFRDPSDHRPKTWVVMDLEKAKELTGYGKLDD